MKNESLVEDYLKRSKARLKSIEVLFQEKSWADVVRESQEVVELTLKALLRSVRVDPPRIHDVGDVLLAEKNKLPSSIQSKVEEIAKISRSLRRDRELAFYGSEDLTPSEFYKKADAEEAFDSAKKIVKWVVDAVR